jgi:hypothetical protein
MAKEFSIERLYEAMGAPYLIGTPDEPYTAVGQFITAFASAEAAVHLIARWLTGLSDEKARAIFNGMRLTDLTDRVRAMMRIDNLDPKITSEIEACLVQLDVITDERHKLVHRSTSYVEGKLLVTNSLTAKSKTAILFDHFDEMQISAMYGDCLVICLRLAKFFGPKESEFDLSAVLHRPWRYKPARPKPPKTKRQKARKARKRLRSS